MNDHGFVGWVHDCRRHGHVLDGEPGAVGCVVFTALRAIVEILCLLNRRTTGFSDGVDAGEPLDTPDHNIRQHDKDLRRTTARNLYLAPM
jgi:hypothetical protein